MKNMKKIRALAVMLLTSICCYAQPVETISGTFSQGLYEYCKPGQVVLSPTPLDNLSVSGSANVVIRSARGITMKPGFSARGWTNGGNFTAQIGQCSEIFCGFDMILDQMLSDGTLRESYEESRTLIQHRLEQRESLANTYIIPVVVHLVGTNVSNAITDQMVVDQIALLNQGFANQLGSTIGVANDAQITFCLAQTTPNGQQFNGITRTTTGNADFISDHHNMEAQAPFGQTQLAQIKYFTNSRYLNIWVVNSISLASVPYINEVVGYSPYPLFLGPPNQFLDGVVIRATSFGITNSPNTNYNQGRALIHEVGHYLGLFHTFDGCLEVTNGTNCSLSGDECCDTPPVGNANQTDCNLLAQNPPHSCNLQPFPDMYQNHMDYAYDNANTCRDTYTLNQVQNMHGTIQTFRTLLVSYQNLLQTGLLCVPQGLNPSFTSNQPNGGVQFCVNQPYGFFAFAGADSYSWTFDGAIPNSSTDQNPTSIIWPASGVYDVTLTVTDITGSASSTMQVFVSDCQPVSGPNANWYFGDKSAISFNNITPTSINPSNINTLEASATVNDNNGNLLFYTNGRTIWDRNHIQMPSANNTMNGSPNSVLLGSISSSKGVVAIPKPLTPDHYYIYTVSDRPTNPGTNTNFGLSQYEVDMTLNGGIGDIISTIAINPSENYASTEGILAVPHCNGSDYWIITKPVNNNQPGLLNPGPLNNINTFFASYLVTSAGMSNTPVLSSSGTFVPTSNANPPLGNEWIGQSAISPDKKYFAYTDITTNSCYLYYFDCGNGTLNYLTRFLNVDGYGISFSPNSKILYLRYIGKIKQFDLSNISICNPIAPVVEFDAIPNGVSSQGSLQLGPDNKIYVSRSFQTEIAVINFPDIICSTSVSNECGYNYNGVQLLNGQMCKGDLPNDIDGTFANLPDDFSFCIRNCREACFTNLGCGNSFLWDFGDGTTSTAEYPCHTYGGAGNYNVTLSINGRPLIAHIVNITAPPPPPTITGPNPVCPNTDLPLSYYAPQNYIYLWTTTNGAPASGVQQVFDVTWTAFPATLSLTITDPDNGCSANSTIAINSFPTTLISITPTTAAICTGQSIDLTASGANSYSWLPHAGLNIFTTDHVTANPTQTTIYTVTGIDANGCTGQAIRTVTVNALPTANAGADQTICTNSSVTLNGSGGISCNWSPSTGLSAINICNPVASPSIATTYTLTVTNSNGCTATDNVDVNVFNNPPSVTIDNIIQACNGTASATASVTGGTGTITYSWNTTPVAQTQTVNNLLPGNYTVTVTDDNGCSATATITISGGSGPQVTITGPTQLCAGQTGTLGTTITGGSPFTYLWQPGGQTSSSIPVSVTGTYYVTVTDNNGCVGTASAAITVNPLPTANAGADQNITCNNSSVTLNGSGGTSCLWSPPTGLSAANSCNPVATPSTTTTYTLTVTDDNGCTDTDDATVTVLPNTVTVNVVSVGYACNGTAGSVTVAAGGGTGPYTYSIAPDPNSQSFTSTGAVTFTNLPGGMYTVHAADINGCVSSSIVVINNTTVTANAGADQVICSGSSVALNGSGGTDCLWSPAADLSDAASCNPVANPVTTTTYTLTVTTNGCTATDDMVITVSPTIPTPVITPSGPLQICSNSPVTLTASAGASYLWSTNEITQSITVNTPGNYHVTVTYAGCGSATSADVAVTVNQAPVIALGPVVQACNGTPGSATVSASAGTGPYSYSIAPNPNSQSFTAQTGAVMFTNLPGDTYTITVTDANGCQATSGVTVLTGTSTITSLTVTGTDVSCYGAMSGTATATVTGGTGTITYLWNTTPAQATQTATGLGPGTYTVTVSDNGGCPLTAIVTINEPPVLSVAATWNNDATCYCCSDGGATVTVTGGVAPYTYSWVIQFTSTEVSTQNPATTLPGGWIQVFVTDATGQCTASTNVFINAPAAGTVPTAAFTTDPSTVCMDAPSGTQFINNSQYAPTVLWDFGDGTTSAVQNPLHVYASPGWFTVTLKVSDPCGHSDITYQTIYIYPNCCSTPENYLTNPNGYFYDEVNDYIVPSGTSETWTISSRPFLSMNGTIWVQQGAVLTILGNGTDPNLRFGPLGRIVVMRGDATNPAGGELILSSSARLTNIDACNTMWPGVEVWGNNTNSHNTAGIITQGKLNMTEYSSIENAHIGILVGRSRICLPPAQLPLPLGCKKYPFDIGYSGARITVVGESSFKNNGNDIRFIEYQYKNTSLIENCFFNGGPVLDPGYHTTNSYTYPNIHSPCFAPANDQFRTTWGIHNTQVYLTRNLTNVVFDEMEEGIRSYNAHYQLQSCTFTDLDYGVRIFNYNSSISNNHVFSGNTFRRIKGIGNAYTAAVEINAGRGDIVGTQNNFGDINESQNQFNIGIYMNNSNSYRIEDNFFTRIPVGILALGSNQFWSYIRYRNVNPGGNMFRRTQYNLMASGNKRLTVKCNNSENTVSGEYNFNWWVNADLSTQGLPGSNSASSPAGNKFTPETPVSRRELLNVGYVPFTYVSHSSPPARQMHYAGLGTNGAINPVINPVAFPSNTTDACSPRIILGPVIHIMGDIYEKTQLIRDLENEHQQLRSSQDNGITTQLVQMINNIAVTEDSLKIQLLSCQSLSDGVIISLLSRRPEFTGQFYKDVLLANSPLGNTTRPYLEKILEVIPPSTGDSILAAQGINPGVVTLKSIENEMEFHLSEKQELLSGITMRLVENDSVGHAMQLMWETDSLDDGTVQAYISSLAEFDSTAKALQKFNNYEPEKVDDQLWKDFTAIMLDLKNDSLTWFDMDSLQEDRIRAIAAVCPATLATVNAQSVLSLVYNEDPMADPFCGAAGKWDGIPQREDEIAQDEAGEKRILKIYPNPADNNLDVEYALEKEEKGMLDIYGVNGIKVNSIQLSPGQQKTTLSTALMNQGMYFIIFTVDGKLIQTEKVIIIHE